MTTLRILIDITRLMLGIGVGG